jgi:anti-anti-sigma factor
MRCLTVESNGDRTLILAGEIDMASEAQLRAALDELLNTDGAVKLDMSSVTFVDSSGTRAIIDAAVALMDRGGLTVASPSPTVVRVFELLGLLPENPAIPIHVLSAGQRR